MAEVVSGNQIGVTMDQLGNEDREKVNQLMVQFYKQCLDSFAVSRNGKTYCKGLPKLPSSAVHTDVDHPQQDDKGKRVESEYQPASQDIRELIHQSMHQALIDNSEILANTVQNIIQNATEYVFRQEFGPRGQAYFSHESAIVPMGQGSTTQQIGGAPKGGLWRPNCHATMRHQENDWVAKIAKVMRTQFGLKPK